jgi:hypothetical protein
MYLFISQANPEMAGWAQIGVRKYRLPGQTQISKGIYLELSLVGAVPSNPKQYFVSQIATMPTSPQTLRVTRDCTTGALAAFIGSTNVTPAIGTGQDQISPDLWTSLTSMVAFAAAVSVELHDRRSHGPGTSSSKYVVSNAKFTYCGDTSEYDISYGDPSADQNPPPELKVSHSLFYGDFYTWDERN